MVRQYGYARVSAKDQNLDRQLDAFAEYGLHPNRIYADKASGKDFDRPEYQQLLNILKAGDVLVIKSIDRLGRNYDEILDEWRHLTKVIGAEIVVLDMPLLNTGDRVNGVTGTLISDIVLQLLSYVAQVERENIRQRQSEGIAAAKARGVKFGRPKKKRPKCYEETKSQYAAGLISRKTAAQRNKVSVSTFGKWLREDGVPSCGEHAGKHCA